MQDIYRDIYFKENPAFNYVDGHNNFFSHLPNLSLVNIFIGQNNSGKSRFLRELVIQEPFFGYNYGNDKKNTSEFFNTLKK
jgi:predicted ATPase